MGACPVCGTAYGEAAKFCQECGSVLAPPQERRRRLIVALFCDLVGSTELGERLDPEALHKVLDRYHTSMRSILERHGGTVEKFIGDAIVGAFGVAVGNEDDTLRAVRAAFEMRDATVRGADLQLRIAVNVGEAVADEAAAREGRIAGDVFNTAARLQSAAEPGEILLSAAAERMVRGRVRLEPLGAIELKGKAEPVAAFRALELVAAPSRIDTPLIGRDRALGRLADALDEAIESGACVLTTVLSPPGVGKSRLAAAFVDAVRGRARVLVAQTPAYGEGVTFAPLVELLAQAADRPAGDPEEVAAELRRRLAAEPDGSPVADRLAQVLGVGEAHAADTAWAVRRLLESLAAERPLVAVVEDVHWAEPPMLDLLDSVVERLHGPVFVLCLARPELLEQRPTWNAGRPRASTTMLPALTPEDARRLAGILLGAEVPDGVVDRICASAEGNPLFLEQLTAMLVDDGLLVDGRWLGPADAAVEIPTTLKALLSARFDRLDATSRSILERAAVEGRRFRVGALRELVPDLASDAIERSIAVLDRRGLILPEDEGAGRWRFAHGLVCEAAYLGLAKEVRAELHERLGVWILEHDGDLPDVDESAARHFERAVHLREEIGERDGAIEALAQRAGELFADAGSRAFAALDLLTTRDLLGRAAVLLPPGSSRRLDILPNLGVALTETGFAEETEALLLNGAEVARASGSERDVLRIRIQLLSNRAYRSPSLEEIAVAIREAEEAAEAFEATGDDVGLAEASIAIEYLEFMRGRLSASHVWTVRGFRHGLASGRLREAAQGAADIIQTAAIGPLPFDAFGETAERIVAGLDGAIAASTAEALAAIGALGMGDQAGFEQADGRRREVVDRNGLGWLGATHDLVIGTVQTLGGDAEMAELRLGVARDVLSELGDVWWVETLDSATILAIAAQGRRREVLRLADALVGANPVGDPQYRLRRHLAHGRALLLRGDHVAAEAQARRGLEVAESTDMLIDRAIAWLTLEEILAARDQVAAAAEARTRALEMLEEKRFASAIAQLA